MDKTVRVIYYKPSDELNIVLGDPRDCVLDEITDEIYVRLDPETEEVLGFTILNFEKRSQDKGQVLPLVGSFSRSKELVPA
jgi:hypothetical protein